MVSGCFILAEVFIKGSVFVCRVDVELPMINGIT